MNRFKPKQITIMKGCVECSEWPFQPACKKIIESNVYKVIGMLEFYSTDFLFQFPML